MNIPSQRREPNPRAAELASQLEDLLHLVRECESWWCLDDRLDLAARIAVDRRAQ